MHLLYLVTVKYIGPILFKYHKSNFFLTFHHHARILNHIRLQCYWPFWKVYLHEFVSHNRSISSHCTKYWLIDAVSYYNAKKAGHILFQSAWQEGWFCVFAYLFSVNVVIWRCHRSTCCSLSSILSLLFKRTRLVFLCSITRFSWSITNCNLRWWNHLFMQSVCFGRPCRRPSEALLNHTWSWTAPSRRSCS